MQALLAKVTRGQLVESLHYGHVVVVDKSGEILKSAGNPNIITYIRSAAKPLQAVPVVESGAAEYFKLTVDEIALMTASHSGEVQHEEVGRRLLKKLQLEESAIACGIHPPQHFPSAKKLYWQQEEAGPLHNNCSGKHLGMLALAKYMKVPIEGYYELKHPVQQLMLKTIADFSGWRPNDSEVGIDGCGVPVFAMPLKNMAQAYAKLIRQSKTEKGPQKVVGAMQQFPHLVAGTDRLCTELIRGTGGRIIGKVGSEGIYCIGITEAEVGIAIKISDGNQRALGPVVIEILNQLGQLTEEEQKHLSKLKQISLQNHRNETIGQIFSDFKLDK